jgi:hypothetical protein
VNERVNQQKLLIFSKNFASPNLLVDGEKCANKVRNSDIFEKIHFSIIKGEHSPM